MISDERLFTQIKQGDIKSPYLLFGNEPYFTASCVSRIIKKVVEPNFESFNLIRFDGAKLSLSELYDSVEALPMMAPKRCVIIRDLDVEKMPLSDFKELTSIVELQNETTVLIIYAVDLSLGYDLKKSKRLKKLADVIEKIGVVCEFAQKDKATLKRALCARAKKQGTFLDMPVADDLIERCGTSYGVVINELDKLVAYAKGNFVPDESQQVGMAVPTISSRSVEECCIKSVDSTSFDLAKAIVTRKYDRAYALLDELFYQRVEALAILGALNMCFLDLYRAKTAMSCGQTAEAMSSDFAYPPNRKFAVKNAFRDVQRTSIESLRRCMDALMSADITLKSSKIDSRVVLQKMLAQMFS